MSNYLLKHKNVGVDNLELSVWQVRGAYQCDLVPRQLASVSGNNMVAVLVKVLNFLATRGISFCEASPLDDSGEFELDEDSATKLSLLFKVVTPMEDSDAIHQVTTGILEMSCDEAAYWHGLYLSGDNPGRVLAALLLSCQGD